MNNGEIYNHLTLRNKYDLNIESQIDGAVILPLFIKLGDNIHALNTVLHGEYAFFITREDLKTGDLTYWLATDPLSVRPAFYFSTVS